MAQQNAARWHHENFGRETTLYTTLLKHTQYLKHCLFCGNVKRDENFNFDFEASFLVYK